MAPPSRLRRLWSSLFTEAPKQPQELSVLDHPLVHFSESDPWTWRDAFAGTCIFGSVGSGKTSGSGRHLARAMVASGAGGLVMTVKPEEAELWKAYAKEAGREHDLILVTDECLERFNFLDYELARETRGGGLTTNIVDLLLTANEAGSRDAGSGGGGMDSYWRNAAAEMLTHAIDILRAGTGRVVLAELDSLISSSAQSSVEAKDPEWWATSFCAQTIQEADRRLPQEGPQRLDLKAAVDFFLLTWAPMAPKQRGGVLGQYTSGARVLQKAPMREILCTETTFTPEDCRKGRIIVLDLPLLQFKELGRVVQSIIKLCAQRTFQGQVASDDLLPVFIWADEGQYFLNKHDQQFLTTARSARVATVFLTQSISNLITAMGENRKAAVDSLLGNLRTIIFHSNSDQKTNAWAAEWFGKSWRMKGGYSMKPGETEIAGGATVSGSESREFRLEPSVFTELATGGPPFGYVVEAIAGKGGAKWNHSKQRFLLVAFAQRD